MAEEDEEDEVEDEDVGESAPEDDDDETGGSIEKEFESDGGFAAACERTRLLFHAGGFARDANRGPLFA